MKKKLAILCAIVIGLCGFAVILNPMFLLIPLALSGKYTGLRTEAPIMEAHQRAVTSFVESEGFGRSRLRHVSYWNESDVIADGIRCTPWKIQLIGLTPEYGPRYFEDDRPPKKVALKSASHRNLTAEESEAIERLIRGEIDHDRLSPLGDDAELEAFRVVALISARRECLKCHEVSEGDALGAFAYTLVPITPSAP